MNEFQTAALFILSVVILIFAHNLVINLAVSQGNSETTGYEGTSYGNVELLGFSQSVSVSVNRPILFGLFTIPVYANGINLMIIHEIFLFLLVVISIYFINALYKSEKYIKNMEVQT